MIKILDHGFVRLIDSMGNDLSVVRAARVSYDAAWRAGEDEGSDARLIGYLWRNKHTSPFEAVEFQFEVKAPIFVLRQWHRHRTWTYNELSARYKELPEEFYIPAFETIGTQSANNKQMRDLPLEVQAGLNERDGFFVADLQTHSRNGFLLYRKYLAAGIPRELARCFLGLNVYSHMFAKVDLHNLLHFLSLRIHEHSQYEIQLYAKAIVELVRSVVPEVMRVWQDTVV